MALQHVSFKESIMNTIQNSGLDIGSCYYIMKSVMSELEFAFYSQVNKELQEKESKDELETTE